MKKFLIFIFIFFIYNNILSQQTPPPVNLGIQNILQESPVWCWVAVSQEIIIYSQGSSPSQLDLAAIAYNIPLQKAHSNPKLCIKTGTLKQIRFLISRFGGRYSTINPPTDPFTLYNTLRSGHPIILQIISGTGTYHVIVINGMEWQRTITGQLIPILFVNDPMSIYIQPLPFDTLIRIWSAAIVVY